MNISGKTQRKLTEADFVNVWTDQECLDCGKGFKSVGFKSFPDFRTLRCNECLEAWARKQHELIEGKKLGYNLHGKREKESFLLPRYRDTDINRLPQEQYKAIHTWPGGDKGILAYGSPGSGKTRCLLKLMERLYYEGKEIAVFYGQEFGHKCAQKFGDRTGENWIDQLIKVDILYLDDLDKLVMTDRVEAELFYLLDTRMNQLKPVFASVNSTGEGMAELMKQSRAGGLIRRLREFCSHVRFA